MTSVVRFLDEIGWWIVPCLWLSVLAGWQLDRWWRMRPVYRYLREHPTGPMSITPPTVLDLAAPAWMVEPGDEGTA